MHSVDYILSHKGRPIIDIDFWGVLAMGGDSYTLSALASAYPTEGVIESVYELNKKYRLQLNLFLRGESDDMAKLPQFYNWTKEHIDEDAFSGSWSYCELSRPKGYNPKIDTVLITANMSHLAATPLRDYDRKIWLCLPENPNACCPDEMLDKVTICRSWKEVLEVLKEN